MTTICTAGLKYARGAMKKLGGVIMVRQIQQRHLDFLQEAKDAFTADESLYTYRDGLNDSSDTLIALRYGRDRDSILIYELKECIANFVQQIDPAPHPRQEVMKFSRDMEKRLKVNDYKGGWKSVSDSFLFQKLKDNLTVLNEKLPRGTIDKHEITIRCADIANYAMMLSDNKGEHL